MDYRNICRMTAVAGFAMLAAACQTTVDVPPPADDEQAQQWTDPIKGAYPEWQPTLDAPQGNPDYEAQFDTAQVNVSEQDFAVVEEEIPAPGPVAAADDPVADLIATPADVPAVPAVCRVVIADDGSFYVDGSVMTLDKVSERFDAMKKAYPATSLVIVQPATAKAPVAKVNEILDACRKNSIAKVNLRKPGTKSPAAQKTAAPKPVRTKIVLDGQGASRTHVIKKGDTLSALAYRYYKNASAWPIIYEANKSVIKNVNALPVKKTIVIPAVKRVEVSK